MVSIDEPELVSRAVSGDTSAFAALCAAHRDRLWRVVSSVAEPADRDDLAQETLIRAFRSIGSYSGAAPFAAWLCRIAVRREGNIWESAATDKNLNQWPQLPVDGFGLRRQVFCAGPKVEPRSGRH